MFIQNFQYDPMAYLTQVLVVMFSICVHEYAHARMALHHGDPTAAWLGHLSLNPLRQMGIPSIIMLLLLGIAWGSVPVVTRNFRSRSSGAWVAAAGPLANLLLALISGGLYVLASKTGFDPLITLLGVAVYMNAVLFIFNMVPLPMLDGWAVLALWIPGMGRLDAARAQQISLIGMLVLAFSPLSGVIWISGKLLSAAVVGLWGAAFSWI